MTPTLSVASRRRYAEAVLTFRTWHEARQICRWHVAVDILLAVRRLVVQGGSTALEQLTKKPGFLCRQHGEHLSLHDISRFRALGNGLLARLRQPGHDYPAMPRMRAAHDQASAFEIDEDGLHSLRCNERRAS